MIPSILLTLHILLFGVKAWAAFQFVVHFKNFPYMMVWAVSYIVVEAWFLHSFWVDIDLWYYEVFAIVDQSIFTIGLTFYLIKGVPNGKG